MGENYFEQGKRFRTEDRLQGEFHDCHGRYPNSEDKKEGIIEKIKNFFSKDK